jgi:hypothetical protein
MYDPGTPFWGFISPQHQAYMLPLDVPPLLPLIPHHHSPAANNQKAFISSHQGCVAFNAQQGALIPYQKLEGADHGPRDLIKVGHDEYTWQQAKSWFQTRKAWHVLPHDRCSTAAADATGILLASVVALLGLFIIPAKKRQAKNELRGKIASMREQLMQSLRAQFEQEMERGIQDIKEAIAPYSRFVRSEQSKLEQVHSKLNETKNGLEQLKVQVQQVIDS